MLPRIRRGLVLRQGDEALGLDDFLAFQEGGKLPLYRVQPATGDPLLLYSDAERREHLSRCAAEHLPAPDILELSEMARLESLAGRLKEMGLALKWFEADREARPKPLFHAKAWNGRGEGYSLRELL